MLKSLSIPIYHIVWICNPFVRKQLAHLSVRAEGLQIQIYINSRITIIDQTKVTLVCEINGTSFMQVFPTLL